MRSFSEAASSRRVRMSGWVIFGVVGGVFFLPGCDEIMYSLALVDHEVIDSVAGTILVAGSSAKVTSWYG